jgi:ribosomal protein S17E
MSINHSYKFWLYVSQSKHTSKELWHLFPSALKKEKNQNERVIQITNFKTKNLEADFLNAYAL